MQDVRRKPAASGDFSTAVRRIAREARPDRGEPTYSVRLIAPFLRALERGYLSSSQIARITPPDPDARIPVRVGLEMLERAVALTGDPALGLRAALEAGVGDFEILEYVAASSPTVGDAIPILQRYVRLLNDALEIELERHGDRAILRFASRVPLTRTSADFQLASFYRGFARSAFSKADGWREVWLTHEQPPDVSPYVRAFEGAGLRFDAPCDAIVMEAQLLERDFGDTDPKLHELLCRIADERLAELPQASPLTQRVRETIAAELRGGNPSVEFVAHRLHMSRRTLARKLESEGTCFKAILDDLRRGLAQRYLALGDLGVSEVAALLGFSDSAAFHRAFRRWCDRSPSEYRRAQRPDPSRVSN
ncbi:MAG TPA: AraC family transcriptional regulator [Myxococcota bacterium]|nr:AraC family transcriptional regulator [Myxococcota bacterium]